MRSRKGKKPERKSKIMLKLKIIVRNFETKKGTTFTKLTIGGKYLPDVTADPNANYQVRFTKKSACEEPKKDGIWEVGYFEKEAWLDNRNPEHPIFRITAQRIRFDKPLPVSKDVAVKVAQEKGIDITHETDE